MRVEFDEKTGSWREVPPSRVQRIVGAVVCSGVLAGFIVFLLPALLSEALNGARLIGRGVVWAWGQRAAVVDDWRFWAFVAVFGLALAIFLKAQKYAAGLDDEIRAESEKGERV